jgi:hypothetical protein
MPTLLDCQEQTLGRYGERPVIAAARAAEMCEHAIEHCEEPQARTVLVYAALSANARWMRDSADEIYSDHNEAE